MSRAVISAVGRRQYHVVWIYALLVAGCLTDQTAERRQDSDAVECAALSAALDSMVARPYAARLARLVMAESTAAVVVADSAITAPWSLAEHLNSSGPLSWVYDSLKLSKSTIKSFRSRNRHATTPCKALATRVSTTVLPDSMIRMMVDASMPADIGFFPDSTNYVFASRVGVSNDRREALLTFSYLCGCLCLENWVVVLSRVGDEPWRVKYTILAGIS